MGWIERSCANPSLMLSAACVRSSLRNYARSSASAVYYASVLERSVYRIERRGVDSSAAALCSSALERTDVGLSGCCRAGLVEIAK
jgi:hypothetical protein